MMATASGTWKNLERYVAKMFGVERYSKRGQGEKTPDVIAVANLKSTVVFSIECKLRGRAPGVLNAALDQARTNARDSHIPIACFKPKGGRFDDVIVGMRLSDFKRILDDGGD